MALSGLSIPNGILGTLHSQWCFRDCLFPVVFSGRSIFCGVFGTLNSMWCFLDSPSPWSSWDSQFPAVFLGFSTPRCVLGTLYCQWSSRNFPFPVAFWGLSITCAVIEDSDFRPGSQAVTPPECDYIDLFGFVWTQCLLNSSQSRPPEKGETCRSRPRNITQLQSGNSNSL